MNLDAIAGPLRIVCVTEETTETLYLLLGEQQSHAIAQPCANNR